MHLYKCLAQVQVLHIPLVLLGEGEETSSAAPVEIVLQYRVGRTVYNNPQPIRCSPSERHYIRLNSNNCFLDAHATKTDRDTMHGSLECNLPFATHTQKLLNCLTVLTSTIWSSKCSPSFDEC